MYQGDAGMPPVREIDLSDGIRIVTTGNLPNINQIGAQIAVLPGNLKLKEQRLNQWLQRQYEHWTSLDEIENDSRVKENPPILLPYERIEEDNFVSVLMYIKAHIFSLNPLKLTTRCQNKQVGPIMEDDWWL